MNFRSFCVASEVGVEFVLDVVVMLAPLAPLVLLVVSERCRLACRRVSVGDRVVVRSGDCVSGVVSRMGSASITASVEVDEDLECDDSPASSLGSTLELGMTDSDMLRLSSDWLRVGVCVGVDLSWSIISLSLSLSASRDGLSCAESV